jgi:hypothetical protein
MLDGGVLMASGLLTAATGGASALIKLVPFGVPQPVRRS